MAIPDYSTGPTGLDVTGDRPSSAKQTASDPERLDCGRYCGAVWPGIPTQLGVFFGTLFVQVVGYGWIGGRKGGNNTSSIKFLKSGKYIYIYLHHLIILTWTEGLNV